MSKYSKHRIAILGGGVAGVSLALFIKIEILVLKSRFLIAQKSGF